MKNWRGEKTKGDGPWREEEENRVDTKLMEPT